MKLSELVQEVNRGVSSYHINKKGIEVSIINIRDLQDKRIAQDNIQKIKVIDSDTLEKARLSPDDVVISLKGNVTKSAIADLANKGQVISSNLVAFSLKDPKITEILVAYLESPKGQKELDAIAVGATQKSININDLLNLEIPLPPPEKQEKLSCYLKLLRDYKTILRQEEEVRERLTASIIQMCTE